MTVDFAINCSHVRPDRLRYPVLVHRAVALLHASFRPATPLRFANPSSSAGWIEDFHLQAVVHARHTMKRPRLSRGHQVLEDREQYPLRSASSRRRARYYSCCERSMLVYSRW